jgi:hypothetical protein
MTFRQFADQHRLKLRRDPEDDTDIIRGREGQFHIFEYSDSQLAVMVMPLTRTAHCWRTARTAFRSAGMVIRQDGG